MMQALDRREQGQVKVVNDLIKAMCVRPDQLTIATPFDGAAVFWKITANLADCKRLVGKGGDNIQAIKTVARLAFRAVGSRKPVEIDRIENTDEPEAPFVHVDVSPKWDHTEVLSLFERVVWACFPMRTIAFASRARDDRSWEMIATVGQGKVNVPPSFRSVSDLSRSLHSLFVPVGINHGRIVYANVTGDGWEDHAEDDAVGRTARPLHVPGPEQDQRVAALPGQHRGQLGPRDVRVHRLGRQAPAGAEQVRKEF